tara:strand:+ start:1050 stop:1295 length:246 start_codon:yes stop_codon:yes gene_type:complete
MTISDDLSKNEKRELFGSYNTNKQTKQKIDGLMRQMANLECTLGIDSTHDEVKDVKNKQLLLLAKIKLLDPIKFDTLKKVI